MRHWIGMVLAVVMAGLVLFLGAWGYRRLLRLPAVGSQLSQLPGGGGPLTSDHSLLLAFAAIIGTGLVAGILIAAPRISPLAAGLPGLVLLGWTGLYVVSVHRAVSLIPLRSEAFGAGFEAMMFNGILAAAGAAMITPMFLPSRWRARSTSYDEAAETAGADEFLTMLDGSGADDAADDAADEPALAGRAERRPAGTRIPTPADFPSSSNYLPDTMVPRPRRRPYPDDDH